MTRRSALPARRATAHVETLHGELCIYEWTTKTVHALNPAAARVWEMCDGVTTIDDMTAAVRRDLDAPGAEAIVRHALAQFARAGLLEPQTPALAGPLLSRRALLRTIGATAAIPVVTSIVAPTPLAAQSGNTHTFSFTGGPQSFVVPAGVTSLAVNVLGASGGGGPFEAAGSGGRVQATLPVTPGETLTIVVGGRGALVTGGFNGGGDGGALAYGGGGASDIRRGSTRLIVAGGGGGEGSLLYGIGGGGGGLVGASGQGSCGGGGGGTQSAGGAGGFNSVGTAGSAGTSGTGGQGAPPTSPVPIGGGGGGGGYFGGGGGGSCSDGDPLSRSSGGGGGGSSFADASATSVVHTQGSSTGNFGQVVLTW